MLTICISYADTQLRGYADTQLRRYLATPMYDLQTLQRVPGDLHWNRLQLSVAAYPQASAQLTLYTLSNRTETPFN